MDYVPSNVRFAPTATFVDRMLWNFSSPWLRQHLDRFRWRAGNRVGDDRQVGATWRNWIGVSEAHWAFDVANTIEDVDEARVAIANSAMTAGADRQVYARDHEFSYAQTFKETPRTGNQLNSDKRFPRKND